MKIITGIFGMALLLSFGCKKILPQAPESEEILAEPIGGLTPEQLSLFARGDKNFAHIFGKDEGLGPIFIQTSCESCHTKDGKGTPFNSVTRFGKYNGTIWDVMEEHGGPQLQHRAIAGYIAETIPQNSTSTQLIAPNVTGLGFFEYVTDAYLLSISDSADMDGDGISGRVNWVDPPTYFTPTVTHISKNGKYIGRFGKKASSINLIQRVTDAYRDDMGITTLNSPYDPINYSISSVAGDNIADPELPLNTLHQTVFYMRTLKNPTRRNMDDLNVIEGENIFKNIGCDKCHKSTMETGFSEIEVLNNKTFSPYTDLLLHDMGATLDDNYSEGAALSSEWRTAPLWGLGIQKKSQGGKLFLLHDGRATSIEQAVTYHAGEAIVMRNNFLSLSNEKKYKLIKFLESL
ncbi:MAG TPA: di-heme oxidoredictase family protein [Bacteroidia bacterium]|nr:di-heme oxidoredictase family protein [Bacteroidia bacterium]